MSVKCDRTPIFFLPPLFTRFNRHHLSRYNNNRWYSRSPLSYHYHRHDEQQCIPCHRCHQSGRRSRRVRRVARGEQQSSTVFPDPHPLVVHPGCLGRWTSIAYGAREAGTRNVQCGSNNTRTEAAVDQVPTVILRGLPLFREMESDNVQGLDSANPYDLH